MISKNNNFIKEDVPSDPQENPSSYQTQKIKTKRNYQLNLHAKTLNSQLAKRIESTKWCFSQSKVSEGDEGFRSLAKTLKSKNNARELKVYGGYSVGNQSLLFISKALRNFESLKTIDLYLVKCDKITDQGLEVLSQGLIP